MKKNNGFSLIEMLVTLLVLMLGLLGLAGLMGMSQKSEMESYQRVQAIVMLRDMAAKINTNRKAAPCYAFTTATTGAPYLGTGATPGTQAAALAPCTDAAAGTAADRLMADADLAQWSDMLTGAGEAVGTARSGAMSNARGCVSFDAVTSTYLISVAWEGMNSMAEPPASLKCGTGRYSDEAHRRVVSITLQLATLL